MNALGRTVQRRAVSVLFVSAAVVLGSSARGDDVSPAALVAARELFHQGTEDADAGRFAEALAKFKRVAEVKETPAVRFNIARCEESLGKTGAALADFELAERDAMQDPQHVADDVAKLAHERADALRPRVPRLALVAATPAPDGLAIAVDGGRIALAALGVPLPLDPGRHAIDATAPGRPPFHTEITLAAGDSTSVTIAMGGAGATADASGPGDDSEASSDGSTQRTLGWVAIGAGGVLAVGSLAFLVLHNSNVSDLNDACPGGRCPIAREAELTDTRSTAVTQGTLSSVFAGVSGAALATGVVLVLTAPKREAPSAQVLPGAPGASAGLTLRATF